MDVCNSHEMIAVVQTVLIGKEGLLLLWRSQITHYAIISGNAGHGVFWFYFACLVDLLFCRLLVGFCYRCSVALLNLGMKASKASRRDLEQVNNNFAHSSLRRPGVFAGVSLTILLRMLQKGWPDTSQSHMRRTPYLREVSEV